MLAHVILCALLSTSAISCTAFSICTGASSPMRRGRSCHHNAPSVIVRAAIINDCNDDSTTNSVVNTISTTYKTSLVADQGESKLKSSKRSRLRRIFRKTNDDAVQAGSSKLYRFNYDYNEMIIGNNTTPNSQTTAVMLIHPIGVGIGRWYHDRLLQSLQERYGDIEHRLVFLTPDLLGSATASGPMNEHGGLITDIPLLNITDWTAQISNLMAEYESKSEEDGHPISSWSVVANGGCAPIALDVASISTQKSPSSKFKASLTNVIISSPPRLSFFLENTDPIKVRKSYKTLSGITGKLFWWYALRKEGRFVRTFSEKNLVGDAASLGEEWTPNCLKAARLHNGLSRYSTFAFLAGALQDGCVESLNALRESGVMIDFIRGGDKRRNKAKSWFWTRKKKKKERGDDGSDSTGKEDGTAIVDDEKNDELSEEKTIQQYIHENGNRGKELFIGGRISLAWEDSGGYAKSLMELLSE